MELLPRGRGHPHSAHSARPVAIAPDAVKQFDGTKMAPLEASLKPEGVFSPLSSLLQITGLREAVRYDAGGALTLRSPSRTLTAYRTPRYRPAVCLRAQLGAQAAGPWRVRVFALALPRCVSLGR